jgi:hypothetical protein
MRALGLPTPILPDLFVSRCVSLHSGAVLSTDRILRTIGEGGGTRRFGAAVRKPKAMTSSRREKKAYHRREDRGATNRVPADRAHVNARCREMRWQPDERISLLPMRSHRTAGPPAPSAGTEDLESRLCLASKSAAPNIRPQPSIVVSLAGIAIHEKQRLRCGSSVYATVSSWNGSAS